MAGLVPREDLPASLSGNLVPESDLPSFGGPPKQRTTGEAITDVGASIVSGIGSLVQFPSQLYGLATGDFSETGLMAFGKSIEEKGKEWRSEALKQKQEELSARISEAEKQGLWEQFKTAFGGTVSDPALFTAFLAEQAPQMIGPGLLGKGVKGAVLAKELAEGAAEKEATKAATKAGVRTALGTSAVMQGADVGAGTYEETYNELIRRGYSVDEAKDEAINLARAAGASGSVISLLSQRLPGAQTIERALVGVPGTTGRLAGAGRGFLGESISEMLEESGGRIAQNIALAQVAPETDILRGVGTAAGLAAIGGGTFGGVSGALQTPVRKELPKTETETTEENLVRTQGQLLLPAPQDIVVNERNFDPLTNPLGNFFVGELTKPVFDYINKDRYENNKPKLKSFSLEDIVDALTYENLSDVTKQGYIDTLLTYKTGYQPETDANGNLVTFSPQDIANVANQRNIAAGELTTDPITGGVTFGTEGMRDFLKRTTGTDNLSVMSQPQLYSAFKALSEMPAFAEPTVLEPETNAVRFTDKQYNNALKGLEVTFDEINTDSLGRTSVIDAIQEFTGLTRRGDAVALYNEAIRRGDLETELTVQNVQGKPTNVVSVKFGGIQQDLPQQFDIRKQSFKQRTEPEYYEIRNGNVTLNPDKRITSAEEAEAYLKKQQANQERLANDLESKGKDSVEALQRRIQAREDQLDVQRAKGLAGTQVFKKLAAYLDAKNKADEAKIRELQEQIAFYRRPLKVVGVGEKPIVEDRYVYYENDKPVAAFATRAQAQEYGVTRLDDAGVQSLLTIAPEAKGVSPKRLKSFAEQEMRRREGKLPQGIEIKSTGVYTNEVLKKVKQLEQDLAPALKRLGLDNVRLKIVDSIANGTADGAYVESLIKIAYDAKDPMGTLRHEGIHALKELGAFTDAEWKVLSNKAKSEWVNKYIKGPGLYEQYKKVYQRENGSLVGFDEYIQEEAIAEAFRDFANTKPPAGLIGQIFSRIKLFMEALGNAFRRQGFQTADSIFERVERGEVRTKAAPTVRGAERFEIRAPQTEEFKQWFGDSKIVDENGNPLLMYHGTRADFTEFRYSQRKAFFVTPDVQFANDYASASGLLFLEKLPDSPNVMPVYIRAENPFDYENREHVNKVMEIAKFPERLKSSSDYMTNIYENVSIGKWNFIEDRTIQKAIKDAGFDAFYLKENGIKNLGVFKPEQIKSVFNETPTIKSKDVRYKLREEEPEQPRKIGARIVGAPPGVTSEQGRTALVKRMTNLLEHPYSMLADSKDWYERSGQAIRDFARGNKDLMERTIRLMALYSQANSLGGNTTATIKSLSQLASGQDTAFAGRFPNVTSQRIPAILAAENFDVNLPGIDDKIMNFYQNLHDAAFNSNLFDNASTIDRWMMRLFGYPHSEDREQGGATGVSATQYKYAKDLIKRIGQKHFENTGERLKPRQIQAVLWTYVKNTTDAEKAKADKKEFTPSVMDFADYVKRATANITWEARPSTSLDIIPGIHTAPRKEQEAFNRAVRGIFENEDGSSKVFEMLKSPVLYKSNNSVGAYENKIVPNTVTQVVLQKDDDLNYITDIANKAAAIFGYVARQDAVPWYRADPTASGKSASVGYKVTAEGIEPDAAFEDRLFKHLNDAMPGVGFTRVDNSFDFVNFRGEDGKPFFMSDKKYKEELEKALKSFSPDVNFKVTPFRAESGYISNNWKDNTDGQSYLREFSPRELADIQPTLDDWRKAYDSIVEQYGREYGWSRPPESAVRPSEEGRGVILGTRQPGASSFTGRHYGKEKVEVLSGSMYGTGLKGAESRRLDQSYDPRIKKRVYFYVPDTEGKYKPKEAGLGTNVYTQKFDNILGPGELLNRLYREANQDANDFESMVVDAGFDGYANTDMGMMVILNHDVPVKFEGDEPTLRSEGRLQLRAPTAAPVVEEEVPTEFEVEATGRRDNLIFLLQDKQIDLKRIIEGIRAAGKEVADKWNAYLQEELFHGRSATRVKYYIDRELQPLLRQMDAAKISLEEMDDYLLARHAKEANEYIRTINKDPKANAGMTDAQADAYIAKIPAPRRRVFERLAQEVDKMTKETRQLMVDYGLESQQTIDNWEKTYKYYVPLFREETEGAPISSGRGFSIRGSTTRQRVGSSRKVVDVLANIAMQRERTIARGEKNRVGNALYGLVLQNPNDDFWMAINPDDVTKDNLKNELIAMGLPPEVADNLSQKPKERILNKDTGLYEYRTNPLWKQQPNVFVTRINGQDRVVIFNQNNERSSRMAVVFNSLDQNQKSQALAMMGTAGEYFDKTINAVGKATRYFAAINTQYNPAFSIYNFMRDIGGAVLNLQSTPLKGKEFEIISNAFVALKSVYQDLRLERAGEPANSKWGQIFEEFELEGGKTGYRDLFNDSESRARALERELESFKRGGVRKQAKAVFDWLSDFNDAIENAIRVATYQAAKEKGMTNAQAASLAKNITVNFNRTGASSRFFTTLYAFFNASVQGSVRIAQTLLNKDGSLSPAGKMIVKGGLGIGVLQAILLAIAGFEEDEPPEFVKDKNLVIPYGDKKYLAIPMPLGFNVIPSFGRRVTEFVMSSDKNVGKAVFGMGNMILDGFNPLGSATFAQTITPTVADPIIALVENKDFTGKPIAKEDVSSLNPTPGYTRAKENASAIGVGLAYAVNLLSGGTDFKKGVISPTPDQIDYLIGQITGGVGREILKIEKSVSAGVKGEEIATYNIPIVGRMVGDVKQKTVQTARFYDNIKDMNEHQQEIDGLIKQGKDIDEYFEKYPEATMYKYADKVYNKVNKLKQKRKNAKEAGMSDEDLKAYDDAILELMITLNEVIKDAKKP